MEREPRKEPKEHKQLDRMIPFNYEQLGTVNDPCFGKGFDLKAKECKRCGDCEVCSIVTSQQMLKAVALQEKKHSFKDVEEAKLVTEQNEKIATIMLKRAKKKDDWCSINKLIPKLTEMFNLLPTDEEYVRQRIIKTGQETKGLKINKSLTKYTCVK